jgi:hypothetical protein
MEGHPFQTKCGVEERSTQIASVSELTDKIYKFAIDEDKFHANN